MKKHIYCILILAISGLKVSAQSNLQHTSKGIAYQIFTHNTGDKIKLNDVVTFNIIQKTDKDSVLFSTYTTNHPVKIQVQPSKSVGDLMDIFPLLTVKDSALVRIPTDSLFVGHEQQRPPFLPKGSFLVFNIKVEKIQSLNDAIAENNAVLEKMKAAEVTEGNKYITDHKLVVNTTPSGLKYVITKASAIKRKPLNGDTIQVNYVGRTLNGKVFDSSIESEAKSAGLQQPGRTYEPIKIVIGQGQVIKGWDEGLLLLNEGSKAKLIIPSSLAYGEKGASADIPPFSTLVFDVELVSIKPGKHPAIAVAAKPAVKKSAVKKSATKKRVIVKKKK